MCAITDGTESRELGGAESTAFGQAAVTRTELFELYRYYEAAAKLASLI